MMKNSNIKNYSEKVLFIPVILFFTTILFLASPKLSYADPVSAIGDAALRGGTFPDPITGKMTTAEEKTRELQQMYPSSSTTPTAGGAYWNQEKIPGFGQTTDFPTYLKQIVNFGFAAIGIMAMFMLMIGAYQYLMAAGNIAKEDSAKTTISSAFSGLVLGLVAFLLLRTINPDLVSFNLAVLQGGLTGGGVATQPTNPNNTPSPNAGKCVEGTGNCAEANMSCFGNQAKNASIVCAYESDGIAKAGGDKCGGTPVSYGLMQMNMTCHDLGMGCNKAFNGCLGTNVSNSSCKILNSGLYEQCKTAMMNPATNIQYACQLQKSDGWGHWTGANKCGIR